MWENIKNYLKDRGFEYAEYEPDGDGFLLFWSDDFKFMDKYIVYNIYADVEGMDIGYVIENSNRYVIGPSRRILWSATLTVDEILHEILHEAEQIKCTIEERKDYLDETMKETMLFKDVRNVVNYYGDNGS